MIRRALWDLLTTYREGLRSEALPGSPAAFPGAASARSAAIAEFRDAHEAAQAALFVVLRDRALDDAHARARAVDLAVPALADLRSRVERCQASVDVVGGSSGRRGPRDRTGRQGAWVEISNGLARGAD